MLFFINFFIVFCLSVFFTPPARAACTGPTGDHGDMLYNLDHTVMQYCNGTNWVSMDASRAGSGSGGIPADSTDCIDRSPVSLVWDAPASRIIGICADITPDAFVFTDLTGQLTATLIASNIIQIKGITAAAPVQIEGDGNPSYRICATSNCSSIVRDWGITVSAIENNQYIQIRLTTAGQPLMLRSATLRIGQASDKWDVMTTNLCPGNTATCKIIMVNGESYAVTLATSSSQSCMDACSARGLPACNQTKLQAVWSYAKSNWPSFVTAELGFSQTGVLMSNSTPFFGIGCSASTWTFTNFQTSLSGCGNQNVNMDSGTAPKCVDSGYNNGSYSGPRICVCQ